MSTLRNTFIAAAAAVGLLTASAATADVIYSFNSTQVVAFGAGPYGTVTLHDNGTGVDFTVGLRSDLNFVNTGGPHAAFSFNATGVAPGDISNILFNGVAPGAGTFTVVAPAGNSPFGTFSIGIDCTGNNCSNGAPGQTADPLTFTVANAELSDFGFVIAGSTAYFAADVICNTGACNGSTGAIGVTGSTTTNVPLPSAITLLGAGLVVLSLSTRRCRQG